jgi:HEAT repeat protein
MAKPRGVDAKLKRLYALRGEAPAPEHLAELRQACADKSYLVVAEAAQIIAKRNLTDCATDLAAAFDRFMVDPQETDRDCRAKIAIVDALNHIEYEQEEVYLRAIRHFQRERKWDGTEEDPAAVLRGSAAFGLLRINYHDVVLFLVELLNDREEAARVAAVQALGESRLAQSIPLLRFKALVGDKEPSVTAECLSALMVADPKKSLPFVARFLRFPMEAIQEGAALALAESRLPEALEVLKEHYARNDPASEVNLLAIAITRLPAALEFLLGIVAGNDQAAALAALNALTIHRHNPALNERLAAIVGGNESSELKRRFKKKFEDMA